jgi:threonine dehydrogenase-like Zn-dependent dehydrogenase
VVLGHEFSGEVVAIGSEVTAVKVGDCVTIDPNMYCGKCYHCRKGQKQFCDTMIAVGVNFNGGFAEYCVVNQTQVYPFPASLSYEEAAMTEPVACCVHGIDMCDISCGDTVAVIGGGMIGLIMLQLAKLKGAAKLILLEPVEEKRQLGKKLGADLTIDPLTEDIHQALHSAGIRRINTVIECVGKPATIRQAIAIAGKKSTVMMFGLTRPDEEVPVKPFELFKKEIVLKASFINPYTQGRALALIAGGRVDVSSMVSNVASLEQLPEILADDSLRRTGKVIISPKL